jgi:hypothetical protein
MQYPSGVILASFVIALLGGCAAPRSPSILKRAECNSSTDTCQTVMIDIIQSTFGNDTSCLGLIPEEIHFPKEDRGHPRTIVWGIRPPSSTVPAARFTFYDEKDHGIVVLNDTNPPELKDGKLGNGQQGNQDPAFYNIRNQHNQQATISYLPIILKTDSTGSVAVCASPDPRIVND